MTKAILRFLVYLPVYVLGILLAYPMVPIGVLFCDAYGRLPWGFQWLETHDALGWMGPRNEPATLWTLENLGHSAGLIHYLWRNKAYTLREKLRAPIREDGHKLTIKGSLFPKKWGFSYLFVEYELDGKTYFEFQPRLGLGSFMIYFRIGWKLEPLVWVNPIPEAEGTALGIFTGISPRTDDWDDFRSDLFT